jgi:putative transposase
MSRPPRIDIPGLPQHLIVRGNNRSTCFFSDQDRHVFLRYLEEAAESCSCAIHAYVLMTNHAHLLATGNEAGAISRLMQSLGRRYALYVNHIHGRTGTLFEGRFKSSVVDSESYFFTVMRYIELNPVRAGMVDHPGRYRWSSFRQNASGAPAGLLVAHREYERLGDNPAARRQRYLAFFELPFEEETLHEIRLHASKCRALGTKAFQESISMQIGRPACIVRPGRKRGQVTLHKICAK